VIRYFRLWILVVAGVLIYGGWVFVILPRTEDPEFDIFDCRVMTRFPGASPDKVEALVTRPLEDAISELEEIEVIQSQSYAGISLLRITLEPDAVPAEVVEEIRTRVEQAKRDLPEGADEPRAYGFNTADIPVSIVSLAGGGGYRLLEHWAEVVQKELERIDDVARVDIEGLPERQITVSVNNERLAQYQVPLLRIWQLLRSENLAVPGGKLDVGSQRYIVKNPNDFASLEDIRSTVLTSFGSSLVYLKDVAEVSDGYAEARYRVRTNQQPAVLIVVQKKRGTNTVGVAQQVADHLTKVGATLPEGFELTMVNDRGSSIAKLLGNLGWNALGGGLIVILLVSLFLGIRQGFVVSVAIPLSVMIAFILMSWTGVELTQVSIFGLVLALGMLVDSSLVVVENIGSHLELGSTLHEAVVKGVDEVRTPVLSSVVTTVVAFVPMLFLTGNIGSFIRGLPLTVIFAMSGSLLVALTVIPLLFFTLWKVVPPGRAEHPSVVTRLIDPYTEVVKWALRNRALALAIALTCFALSLALVPLLGFQLFPKAEKDFFLINVRLPREVNLHTTDVVTAQVEKILAAEPAIRDFTANIGRGSPQVYYNEEPESERASYAQIVVNLRKDLEQSVDEYVATLRPKLAQVAGATVEPRILEQGPVGGAAIQVRVLGEELDTLAAVAAQIKQRLTLISGVIDVRDSLGERIPRLVIDLNRNKAALLGVDSLSFSRTVFMALNGEEATRYRGQGNDLPLVVRLSKRSLTEIADLQSLYLPSQTGGVVPFGEVAQVRNEPDFAQINRRHLRRTVTVGCDVSGRLADDVLRQVRTSVAELELPQGYTIEYGGQDEEQQRSFAGLREAMVLALLLIYAVLAIQFNSFIQPIVILLTIPFGITGAILGLSATGNPFGFMAFVGVISLTGIIINDSIVLTDFANSLQRVQGMRKLEALIEAGRRRFQPVVLTSVTTIAGLTPLAIWGGSLWSPLASAVIVGLIGSTVLILVVLPVIYSLLVQQREAGREHRLLTALRRRMLSREDM